MPESIDPEVAQQIIDENERLRGVAAQGREAQSTLRQLADAKFGFLKRLKSGVVKCAVYRRNESTYEYFFVKNGRLNWDVAQQQYADFMQRIATSFGPGMYRVAMEFPEDSGIPDTSVEFGIDNSEIPKVEDVAPEGKVDPQRSTSSERIVQQVPDVVTESLRMAHEREMSARTEAAERDKIARAEFNALIKQQNDTIIALMGKLVDRPTAVQPVAPPPPPPVDVAGLITALGTFMSAVAPRAAAVAAPANSMEQVAQMLGLVKEGIALGRDAVVNPSSLSEGGDEGGDDDSPKWLKTLEKLAPLFAAVIPRVVAQPQSPLPLAQPQPAPQPRPQPRPQPTPQPAPQPASRPQPTKQEPSPQDGINFLVDELLAKKTSEECADILLRDADKNFIDTAVTSPDVAYMFIVGQRPDKQRDAAFKIKFFEVVNLIKSKREANPEV